jgi:hypothetical protein
MSSVANPRRNARKRNPPATCRRALELLAVSRDGATEAILVARGFPSLGPTRQSDGLVVK